MSAPSTESAEPAPIAPRSRALSRGLRFLPRPRAALESAHPCKLSARRSPAPPAHGAMPLADVRPHHVRRFVADLHGKGLGGRSLARVLSSWRAFYRYLARDHGFEVNPCARRARAEIAAQAAPLALARRSAAAARGDPRRRRSSCAIARCSSSSIRPACGCRSSWGSTLARLRFRATARWK